MFEELRKAVIEGDIEKTEDLCRKALEKNVDPLKIVNKGLGEGVKEVGDKFGRGEAFLVDLIMAGQAMKTGMSILLPKIRELKRGRETIGKALLGTVKGDIHSIGKDILATMMEAEGIEVMNLGEDVPTEEFIAKVREYNPDLLGLSSLLTMTMPTQKEVIEALKKEGLRENVKVMVGGAPTTQEWAKEIGADIWAGDALGAVKLAKAALSRRKMEKCW